MTQGSARYFHTLPQYLVSPQISSRDPFNLLHPYFTSTTSAPFRTIGLDRRTEKYSNYAHLHVCSPMFSISVPRKDMQLNVTSNISIPPFFHGSHSGFRFCQPHSVIYYGTNVVLCIPGQGLSGMGWRDNPRQYQQQSDRAQRRL